MVARFHYNDDELIGLIKQTLSPEQEHSISHHIESCEACQSRVEEISLDPDTVSEIQNFLDADLENPTVANFEFQSRSRICLVNPADQSINLDFLDKSNREGSIGSLDNRYEILGVIGRGGMGLVMHGYDRSLARDCAIKVLAPELSGNAAARRRFSREAKSAAAVVHEHVIPIQTVNDHHGLPYLDMPLILGKSLQQRVAGQQGTLKLVEILRIGMQIASGLAAAHQQGLVHRDVKPANIMLENGVERVLIADFGLAQAADDANSTRSHVISGTPQYMSPEQASGADVDRRSDLFSLGSVLYFMCCGHSPFRASTTMGVLNRIVHERPRSIRRQNPEIPEWLETIIFALLEKNPDRRYQSASKVAKLLGSWLAHVQQPESIPAPASPARPASAGNRWHFGITAGILILSMLAGAWHFGFFGPVDEFDSRQPDYPLWAPFDAVQWDGENPSVHVEGQWYQLVAIHGVTVEQIREKCKQERWRFQK